MLFRLALITCVSVALVLADGDCSNTPNIYPVYDQPAVLLNSTQYGKLYITGPPGNQINILHVSGTPYQMGYAHGTLLKAEIADLFNEFQAFLDKAMDQYLDFLPKDIRTIIENLGVAAALEFTAELTKKYTPDHFFEEIRGLSDSTGISYDKVLQFHMFPELIKAACSMYGAWGPATAKNAEHPGSLVHLRALDWGFDNPLTKFPLYTVFHPEKDNGKPFATLGWKGFVGAVTGYSESVAISEKVWLHYNLTSSRAGIPFHFLMRDVVQYDHTIADALNRMYNNERTCSVFLGVGESHTQTFRAVEYSHEEIITFDDINYPYYTPSHPQLEGAVFLDKHTQPSADPCLGSLMVEHYGNLDHNAAINIVSRFATGDNHIAVYEYAANTVYVAFAGYASATNHTWIPAYDRQFIKFDMTELFSL